MSAAASRLSALGALWSSYALDHILPGVLYTYAAIGNSVTLVEIASGEGPASGLEHMEQTWLLIQRGLFTIFVGLIALLFIIRRPRAGGRPGLVTALILSVARRDDRDARQQVRAEMVPALVALGGTNALFLQGLAPVTTTSAALTIPGVALGLFGVLFSIWALASLGRCFGIFPEVRGLVTHGPYARVRHPLYLAEMVSALGGLLSTLSVYTAALYAVFVALQYWRAINEERVLRQSLAEYAAYEKRTWRILPGLH